MTGARNGVRHPLLAGADASRALRAAESIFARGVAHAEREDPKRVNPGSLGGFGGSVLLADALARAGCLANAAVEPLLGRALVYSRNWLGLHDGAAGLLVVLDAIDPQRTALARARERLRDVVAASIRDAPPPDVDDALSYDLISGVAGRAIALGDASPDEAHPLFDYAERFATAVERRRDDTQVPVAPVNLGVAHGVPGVLAALNAVSPRPHPLARRYVDLLLSMSHHVGGARRWDSRWLPGEVPPARRAWCYHTAGVAAVLYDRALLDGDDALRAVAVGALDGVLHDDRDDDPNWFVPSLCHGRTGVAAIAWHVANEGERFARTAETLARTVLDEYDERLPLGYRSYDLGDGHGPNSAGFLDGSVGISLFLVDAVTAHARRWLPLLGLLPD